MGLLISRLYELAETKRIPVMAIFELTWRCNLKCRHCYLSENNRAGNAGNTVELSLPEWKNIISQLADMGGLYLTFTGGEVFLRQDTIELVSYARELLFDVSVFSNGTLIDKRKAKDLARTGVNRVEVSLYGRPQTHDYIVQVEGAFWRSLEALDVLKANGVNVGVKCPLMTLSFDDYPYILELCNSHGFRYMCDHTIVSGDDGTTHQVAYRVDRDRLKRALSDPRLVSESAYSAPEPSGFPIMCAAGRSFMNIGPDGTVYPCVGWRNIMGSARKHALKEIWYASEDAQLFSSLINNNFKECNSCALLAHCPRCPGLADKETGDAFGISPTCCELARVNNEMRLSLGE